MSKAVHGAGSPAADSPVAGHSASPSPAPTSAGPTPAEIAARTIAVLGIPDAMTDARVRSMLSPIGTIVKLVLQPQHGGAVVEFTDGATAGKAVLAIEGHEIEGGKKLRTGTVAELFQEKSELRVDRIDQAAAPKKTAVELMPPPPTIGRAPVMGRAGAKRGLGFVGGVKKGVNGTATCTTQQRHACGGRGQEQCGFQKAVSRGKVT